MMLTAWVLTIAIYAQADHSLLRQTITREPNQIVCLEDAAKAVRGPSCPADADCGTPDPRAELVKADCSLSFLSTEAR